MPIPYSYEPSNSDSGDTSDTSSDDSDQLADTSWLTSKNRCTDRVLKQIQLPVYLC